MDPQSQETLRMVEENYDLLFKLQIGGGGPYCDADFHSSVGNDYSTLGAAIGNNTHLTKLTVNLYGNSLAVEDGGFYDGLKHNSSIREVNLRGDIMLNNNTIIGGVLHEVLKVYEENSHLTTISIRFCNLENGGDNAVAATLRNCTNLNHIDLSYCVITDEQLLPVVEAVRGHRSLEVLDLTNNIIGNVGCEALTTLLEDPNCHICTLVLQENQINMIGVTTIVNSLSKNSRLRYLDLGGNPATENQIDFRTVNTLIRVLCNKSNINDTYNSNHTLELLELRHSNVEIDLLLDLNKDTNKQRVAIKKILKHHRHIDMEPLFDWEADEDEQNLKALPYAIDWFDRAEEAVADDDKNYNVKEKKLSAILQFTKAMPLLFVSASHVKKDEHKKRKRDDNM